MRSSRHSLCLAVVLSAVVSLLGAPAAAPAAATAPTASRRVDLPSGGPALLRRPLARSTQLSNAGVWQAPPILVSGASAYRQGEFLYQDFLYDDRGDGSSPYPAGAAYAGNAADFVELRVKPLRSSTAVRITYNTLVDPDVSGTTLAFGTSKEAVAWPHNARVTSPAQLFVTVHGNRAEVVGADDRAISGAHAPVTVDRARRQVEVRVPYSLFDPRGRRGVRLAAATGVWDTANEGYRAPDSGAALHNVAFRFNETVHPRGIPVATWWRDRNQAAALSSGDISQFAAKIDFTKLARRANDDMADQPTGVPTTGSMTRIYVSHFSDGQGRGTTTSRTTACDPPTCSVQFRGALQPYFIHVPAKRPLAGGYGLTAYLHGCGNNHHELFGSQVAQELADRGPASLVVAGGARGDCLWYQGVAMANLFEIWADVARRYDLDPDITALTGYSMGGYGTFRTATLYPELFARAMAIHPCVGTGIGAGAADSVLPSLASLRHVPMALWNSVDDPLCHYTTTRQVRDELDRRGYATNLFTLANDHFTDITNDVMTPGIDWVGGRHVVRNPSRVTYVVNPSHSYPRYGLNPDHAYWVSGLRTRNGGSGSVDVRSHGLGVGDVDVLPLQAGAGVLTGGELFPALPYAFETRSPAPVASTPKRNELDVTARNLSTMTIDVRRAGVTCGARLQVDTDVPVAVTLAGCPGGPRSFAP